VPDPDRQDTGRQDTGRQDTGGPFTSVLLGFARELRAAGLRVGTGDVLSYIAAMTPLDPTDLLDLYWAGCATLLTRHEDESVYDRVFRDYFLGEDAVARGTLTLTAESVAKAEAALVMPDAEPGPAEDEERPVLGWMASDVDALKHRSFTACTPEELAALRRIMTRMRLMPPRRRTRRTRPATAGPEPDLRATIRESMRMHGEPPGRLFFRRRKTKLRPLILVLDVSGSMAAYSRHLLQFAHTARHAAGRVEVFCFGSRWTRPWRRRREPWRTGTAAPGSASRSTSSCANGAVAACAAAGWWSSAPTGSTAVTPRCSPLRWNACRGCATASCGSTRTRATTGISGRARLA